MRSFAPAIVDAHQSGRVTLTFYDGASASPAIEQCIGIPEPWLYQDMCNYIHQCTQRCVGRGVVARFDGDGFYYDVRKYLD